MSNPQVWTKLTQGPLSPGKVEEEPAWTLAGLTLSIASSALHSHDGHTHHPANGAAGAGPRAAAAPASPHQHRADTRAEEAELCARMEKWLEHNAQVKARALDIRNRRDQCRRSRYERELHGAEDG